MQVLFSSIAALLGSAGQASYAAANASLDALAVLLHRAGTPTLSIQWGPWAHAGMAAAQGSAAAARLLRLGLGTLSAQSGLEALCWVITGNGFDAVQTVASLHWPTLLRDRTALSSALFEEMREAISADRRDGKVGKTCGAGRVTTVGTSVDLPPARLPLMGRQHQAEVGKVLVVVLEVVKSLTGAVPAPDEPVMAAGLDSLGALELRNALAAQLGVNLPATLAFDYPTPLAMADHTVTMLQHAEAVGGADSLTGIRASGGDDVDAARRPSAMSQTAVLASAGRLPHEMFCTHDAAKDVVSRVPFEVQSVQPPLSASNTTYCTGVLSWQ